LSAEVYHSGDMCQKDEVQPSTFNAQPPQPSTFNLQPSTFNLQHWL